MGCWRYIPINEALEEILELEGDTIFGQEASGSTSDGVECSASTAGKHIDAVVGRAVESKSDDGDGFADHFLDLEIDTSVTAHWFLGNSGAQNDPDNKDDKEGSEILF